ncbi:MAG: gliding motility-associated C-terminal domain-containing protein [Flavobacteriaceae bacterium]|nr:gliding motility-associated C-terminal domain-containing protein [Bacteroidia bacterium]NNL61132.1 gliding motility-associated C-terminal domain-containing protein [Flavobacteriaceae bacterium]
MKRICLFCFLLSSIFSYAQDVSLYSQFNGRYDYTAIGNTMNLQENGIAAPCTILTESGAILNLEVDQVIQAAYLYWAGTGEGDFDVVLNGNAISAERIFSESLDENRIFFAAFSDVTEQVIEQGNGIYTLSELDLTSIIGPYCPSGTNFAGWAITVIFQDNDLPLNQINVYDGLQSVPTELTITLENLNVLDNQDAKIGFIAWEGDSALAVNEQLTINGNLIGNPPLNPPNNAFNGTNSFTEESDLFNMDIDFYGIQDNISIGDTSATIQLTSGQDFVMINNIITVLNSQLPDATISIENVLIECNSRNLTIDFIISNSNSTASLPINTPIAFYADSILIGQSLTSTEIEIGGSESASISLEIPEDINNPFILEIIVDDDGSGNGIVAEINEINNMISENIELQLIPPIRSLPRLISCDEGFNSTIFDLTEQYVNIQSEPETITFYLSEEDAELGFDPINSPMNYENLSSPQDIFVRICNNSCFETAVFELLVENCPPRVPEGFSPNDDGINDSFFIDGLRDIFENYELFIYNRYGTLIYQGNNSIPDWNGTANKGLNNKGKSLPVGTYFYVLNLNDPDFRPLKGWVYLNK